MPVELRPRGLFVLACGIIMLWQGRQPEDAFGALTQLLFLLEHVLLLSLSRLVVLTSSHLGPPHGAGRSPLCFITPLFTHGHGPLCAWHLTGLSSCLLYLLQGN